jgi:hypothetical protein
LLRILASRGVLSKLLKSSRAEYNSCNDLSMKNLIST